MRFTPKSEKELQAERGILKAGNADFEVLKAAEKISNAGNPMIELNIKVWDEDGKSGQIFDYLVSTAQWKIRNFAEAIGNLELYESGDFPAEALLGKSGRCVLKLEKSEQYGDQIKIKDYLPPAQKSALRADDDMPPLKDFDIDF